MPNATNEKDHRVAASMPRRRAGNEIMSSPWSFVVFRVAQLAAPDNRAPLLFVGSVYVSDKMGPMSRAARMFLIDGVLMAQC